MERVGKFYEDEKKIFEETIGKLFKKYFLTVNNF